MITEIEGLAHLWELLPNKCMYDVNQPGDAYFACNRWVETLGLNINRETCLEILKDYGAWDDEELDAESNGNLNIRLLWLAVGYMG